MAVSLRAFAGPLLLQLAVAVSPKALEQWFSSSGGLGMRQEDAHQLANKTCHALTLGGVSVAALQALKGAMAGKLAMHPEDIRDDIFLLAEQHVDPDDLTAMYVALSSSYTLSGGLGLPPAEAAQRALVLARDNVVVSELYDLYKAMYGYFGLGFDQATAQQASLQASAAGADAATFKDQYKQAIQRGASKEGATAAAMRESVNIYMGGVVNRYARENAQRYSSREYQQHYGDDRWLDEWLASPIELRVPDDLKEHSAGWFQKQFGSQWQDQYIAAAEAIQERMAEDGKIYDMQQFGLYYSDAWQARWAVAPEVPCTICGPFARQIGAATGEIVV